MSRNGSLDGLGLVGLAFLGFMVLNVLKDQGWIHTDLYQDGSTKAAVSLESAPVLQPETGSSTEQRIEIDHSDSIEASSMNPNVIAPPYANFILTQGLHGTDYGHLAIDISAGKGAEILSPINGWVSNLYIDEWGNPSLALENERYLVELLHGKFKVKIGDPVTLGQPIGKESNQGNTVDAWGYSCRGRDCGYHTHLNIYDKTIGANVNPLQLFPIP